MVQGHMNKNYILSITMLSGTILGAGIFSLPYILGSVGLLIGAGYLIFFGLVYFLVHRFYGEALLVAPPGHNFLYFLKESMGARTWRISSAIIIAEFLLILTVYLILAPTFGAFVFGAGVAGTAVLAVFWALGSLFIFLRLDVLGWTEFLGVAAVLVFTVFIFGFGSGSLNGALWPKDVGFAVFLLPFGPLLFSLAGRSAMAQVVEKERDSEKAGRPFSVAKVAFWGTFIAAAVYFLFVMAVLRLTPHPAPDALSGLGGLPAGVLALLGIIGLLAIWKSYIVIGLNTKEMLELDLKVPKVWGALAVIAAPLAFYAVGLNDFLSVIGLLGSLFLAFDSALVVHIWRRLVPNSKWRPVSWALYAIFLAAAIYEIISLT
jgi:tryptophan-specific transport protein